MDRKDIQLGIKENRREDEESGKISTNFPEEFPGLGGMIRRWDSKLQFIAEEVGLLKESLNDLKGIMFSFSSTVSTESSHFPPNTNSQAIIDEATMASKKSFVVNVSMNSNGRSERKISQNEGDSMTTEHSDIQSNSQGVRKMFRVQEEVKKAIEDEENLQSLIDCNSNSGVQNRVGHSVKVDSMDIDSYLRIKCHSPVEKYSVSIQGMENSLTEGLEHGEIQSDVLDISSNEGSLQKSTEVSSPNDSFETSIGRDSPKKDEVESLVEPKINAGEQKPIGHLTKVNAMQSELLSSSECHPVGEKYPLPILGSQKSTTGDLEQCQSDVFEICTNELSEDLQWKKNEQSMSTEVSTPHGSYESSTGSVGCVDNLLEFPEEQKNDDADMDPPKETIARVFSGNLMKIASFGYDEKDCIPIQARQESTADGCKSDTPSFDNFESGEEKFQSEAEEIVDKLLVSTHKSTSIELPEGSDCNLMQNLESVDGEINFSINEGSGEKKTELMNRELEKGGVGTFSDESKKDSGVIKESIDSYIPDQCHDNPRPEFGGYCKKSSEKWEPPCRSTWRDSLSQLFPFSKSLNKDSQKNDSSKELLSCDDQLTIQASQESTADNLKSDTPSLSNFEGGEEKFQSEAEEIVDKLLVSTPPPVEYTGQVPSCVENVSVPEAHVAQAHTGSEDMKREKVPSEDTRNVVKQEMKDECGEASNVRQPSAGTLKKMDSMSSGSIRHNCVNTMMKMTEIIDCSESKSLFVRQIYEAMYARCSLNAIFMKFLIGQPKVSIRIDCESETILRMKESFKDHDGEDVKGSERRTFADFDEKVIYLGGLVNQKINVGQVIGVLSSSMCLMSLYLVFDNCGRPYAEGDQVKREQFRLIIEEALNRKRSGGQLMRNIKWALERKTWTGKEIAVIAVLSQIITLYGWKEVTSMLCHQLPSLLHFFEDQVVATLSRECEIFTRADSTVLQSLNLLASATYFNELILHAWRLISEVIEDLSHMRSSEDRCAEYLKIHPMVLEDTRISSLGCISSLWN